MSKQIICQSCFVLKGTHIYKEMPVCCGCFDELVDETYHQIIIDVDRIERIILQEKKRTEKSETDKKLMQEAYDRLAEEFKQWAGGKAKLEKLRERSNRLKN